MKSNNNKEKKSYRTKKKKIDERDFLKKSGTHGLLGFSIEKKREEEDEKKKKTMNLQRRDLLKSLLCNYCPAGMAQLTLGTDSQGGLV